MKTYSGYRQSWEYICSELSTEQGKLFVWSLGASPLYWAQFMWLYHKVGSHHVMHSVEDGGELLQLKDAALYKILQLLKKQSVGDKIYLVSHGADHGVRVMGQCISMLENPFFSQHMHLGSERQRLTLMITCLLHDVGYGAMPDASVLDLPKWTHAQFSYELIRRYLDPALSALLTPRQIDDLLSAIKHHNMDADVCDHIARCLSRAGYMCVYVY
eukprot:GFYU01030378.1.p1 GENE.GFYU01030378.1~~GFYU01030378.1.p1  ORF type:complete len:215 (+),score=40.65 GFYU01030378.1:88-732(+)